MPRGNGFWIVSAATNSTIEINLAFSKAIDAMPVVPQDWQVVRFSPERFDGNYVSIKRCLDVAWCGSMIEARLALNFSALPQIWLSMGDLGYRAAFARICAVAPGASTAPLCVVNEPSPSGATLGRVNTLLRANQGLTHLEVDAASAASDSSSPGYFWVGGDYLAFDLPERHPLEGAPQASEAQQG